LIAKNLTPSPGRTTISVNPTAPNTSSAAIILHLSDNESLQCAQ
jgi:hypothetical protein